MATNLEFRPADPAIALPFVACVHWPRSGHHLMVRLLGAVLGKRFGYCSFYGHNSDDRCCGKFPCRKPGISFAKQHDLQFDCAVPHGEPLLVQYRRFDESLISLFEVRVSQGLLTDSEADFRALALQRAKHYRKFVAKWVDQDIPNRHVVTYSDLIEEPRQTLLGVLRLFGAEHHADRIDRAVDTADHVTRRGTEKGLVIERTLGVVNKTRAEAFRYYDADFFARLAAASSPGAAQSRPG